MEHLNMKYKWLGPAVMLAFMAGGCTTGQRLFINEQKDMANIRQPFQMEKKNGVDTTAMQKVYTTFEGKNMEVVKSELDPETGEYITTRQLGEVTVVGRSKTVAERNGEVNLDFIVRVPRKFIQPDWCLTVAPVLRNGSDIRHLDSINLKGKSFEALQKRKAVYNERRVNRQRYIANSLEDRTGLIFSARERRGQVRAAKLQSERLMAERQFEGMGLRLDTVMQAEGDFHYYYSQKFNTNDLQTRLKLYFNAYITNSNDEIYPLQKGDTLDFVISSMMQFLDRTPRYKRMTIQKRVTEDATANVLFRMGDAAVIDTLGDNYMELDKIARKIEELNNGHEFVIDSIVMTAYGSPEGLQAINNNLARKRAEALKNYLLPVLGTNAEAVDLLQVKWQSEDWVRTRELIAQNKNIVNKVDILHIIDTEKNFDVREQRIRTLFPTEYEYIKQTIYPQVRSVDFKFHLARRNMVEETMYTDVIDTLYADALVLMDQRKYRQAMPKLLEYEDWNTAICYMSLNYNAKAWNILINVPKTSDRQYLLAVLAARMGNKDTAVQLYSEACKMDESKIMRGELDPEIAALIREYGLNNKN